MTKSLPKAIMRRSELKSTFLKNRTIEIKTKYKKNKSYYKRLYKKEQKHFCSNLELIQISIQSSTMTLVNKENNQIISNDVEIIAETFSNPFESVVANVGINEYESSVTDNTKSGPNDGVDLAIEKYKDNPSTKIIKENVSLLNHVSVLKIYVRQIYKNRLLI